MVHVNFAAGVSGQALGVREGIVGQVWGCCVPEVVQRVVWFVWVSFVFVVSTRVRLGSEMYTGIYSERFSLARI